MSAATPGFERDIKPLFRDGDVSAMLSLFDLRSYEECMTHAEAIYESVDDGSMPCDEMWPVAHVELFRRWIDTGMSP